MFNRPDELFPWGTRLVYQEIFVNITMHKIKSIVSSRHETSGGKRIKTAITFPKYMRDQKINIKSDSYTIQPSISYPPRKILMLVKAQTTIMEPN